MGLSCRLRKMHPLLKLLRKSTPKRQKTILQAGGRDITPCARVLQKCAQW